MLIVLTTLTYGIGYFILQALGIPDSSYVPKPIEQSEYRSRILGTANAVILIIGSALCFKEWPHEPVTEGWFSTLETSTFVYPVIFSSLFLGFLLWDLIWVIWHAQSRESLADIIHHLVFIIITQINLRGNYMYRPFAWLALTELSTPFLHLRWFLSVGKKKRSIFYLPVSFTFAFTFIVTRVVCYALGLVDLWNAKHLWMGLSTDFYFVVWGLHVAYVLNLFWSIKVIEAVLRVLSRHNKEKMQVSTTQIHEKLN